MIQPQCEHARHLLPCQTQAPPPLPSAPAYPPTVSPKVCLGVAVPVPQRCKQPRKGLGKDSWGSGRPPSGLGCRGL